MYTIAVDSNHGLWTSMLRLLLMQDTFKTVPANATVIKIAKVAGEVITRNSVEAARIEQNWQHLCHSRSITENAGLLQVVDAEIGHVTVAPTLTYRDIVGVRLDGAPHTAPYMALSALAVLRTADDYVVFLYRDSGDWPASFEFPGGFVRSHSTPATIDDFVSSRVSREVSGLTIRRSRCFGVYRLPSILEHMYVYEMTLAETAAVVCERYGSGARVLSAVSNQVDNDSVAQIPLHHPSALVYEQYVSAGVPGYANDGFRVF